MIVQGHSMLRRHLLASIAALAAGQPRGLSARAITLATAEIEVAGDWRRSLPQSAATVVKRMREVCLDRVPLLSDRQPTRLRVESRVTGGPSIWLHRTSPSLAWINVNIGERDWCKLAYQFAHELGHVLANSWGSDAIPAVPCQWLEEALVEAFSIRGLGLLADSWARDPPFFKDQAFAASIRQYRDDARRQYVERAATQGAIADPRGWFRAHRAELEREASLNAAAGALVPALLSALETDFKRVAELGALNRWPERTNLELDAYLSAWVKSCSQIGCEGNLAELVRRWSRE
jgi:hypothetical protein